ncbi:MAG: NADH-quinone oxidoreductase subunit J [Planctomycetota bacterium]
MSDAVMHPVILYALLALGAVGVALAMPRRTLNVQLIGGLIAAVAGGGAVLALTLAGLDALPNLHFYAFAFIALASALRMITHPRPVYAALYFILTILASAGLYLILSAEFMAFALIIIYAGAILITYLFVIMLATQAPSEERLDVLSDYDAEARSPVLATIVGFVLLGALTSMIFSGASSLPSVDVEAAAARDEAQLALLPRRIEEGLRKADLLEDDETLIMDPEDAYRVLIEIEPVPGGEDRRVVFVDERSGPDRAIELPADLRIRNVETLAFNFLNAHPGTIEIAGIILMMAMLGAVVLSRKQVQLDEEAKAEQTAALARMAEGGGPDA